MKHLREPITHIALRPLRKIKPWISQLYS